MATLDHLLVMAGNEAAEGEVADRLEHRKPRFAVRVGRDAQDGLFDEAGQVFEEIQRGGVRGIKHDRLGGVQRAATDEDRQAGEEELVPFGQMVVTPGDGVVQRSLPGRRIGSAARQERQVLLQPRRTAPCGARSSLALPAAWWRGRIPSESRRGVAMVPRAFLDMVRASCLVIAWCVR